MNKICTKCGVDTPITGFYLSRGKPRGDCKECTKATNADYASEKKSWLDRDHESMREYMKEYRANNPEAFKRYRQNFKEKNPEYFREYYRDKKNRK